MASPKGAVSGSDVEVTLEDQMMINRFARLNNRCEEYRVEITSKEQQLSNIEEALNELILNPEGNKIHN